MNKNDITLSIVFIGKINSGKSTLSQSISEQHHFPIASFSGYLKDYCIKNGMPYERNDLQDLGSKFIQNNHIDFLQKVINFSRSDLSSIIFDGVRHKVIAEGIKLISTQAKFIYIDADVKTRYERYLLKNKDNKFISYDEFLQMDNHPVEKEIESLKGISDLVIDSTKDIQANLILVSNFYKKAR